MQHTSQTNYSVHEMHGCRVIFGPVPMADLVSLTAKFGQNAVLAVDIADKIGASFVVGEPADIALLSKADLPISAERRIEGQAARKLGLNAVSHWLEQGERGLSANAMCKRFFGVPGNAGADHPRDPSDLRRCIAFLDATDSRSKILLMANVSREWAALVFVWEELEALLKFEVRHGSSAPRTYALMREALGKIH
ncbi:MAG: hypothetical protein PHV02_07225 [Rhodocyclaceae bacterium]|nr:hypothetical protein [Rhodocyclaceae bacterium]